MQKDDAVVAVFATHAEADAAVKKLAGDGFSMKGLSLVGKGYHTEETVAGFYNIGDRVKFWGSRGAFWGGMWGLFFGGLQPKQLDIHLLAAGTSVTHEPATV